MIRCLSRRHGCRTGTIAHPLQRSVGNVDADQGEKVAAGDKTAMSPGEGNARQGEGDFYGRAFRLVDRVEGSNAVTVLDTVARLKSRFEQATAGGIDMLVGLL